MYEPNRGVVLLRQQKIDDSNPGAVLLRQQKMEDSNSRWKKKGPNPQGKRKEKQGVCSHYGLAIYIIKKGYLKGKRSRIMETQILHHAKI